MTKSGAAVTMINHSADFEYISIISMQTTRISNLYQKLKYAEQCNIYEMLHDVKI